MAEYLINEWEENGYDDSDFRVVTFNDETGEFTSHLIGSTRFAGGIKYPENTSEWTPEAAALCLEKMEERIFQSFMKLEKMDVETPNSVKPGDKVRFLESKKTQVKEQVTCEKCEGSGKWTNPRNSADKRECFACKGTGEVKGKKAKKGDNGKVQYTVTPAGTVGTVTWFGTFQTIYARGYNTLNRFSGTVGVQLEDGSIVYAPLEKLRLDREVNAEDMLRRAKQDVLGTNAKPLVSGHGGWLTTDFLGNFLSQEKSILATRRAELTGTYQEKIAA